MVCLHCTSDVHLSGHGASVFVYMYMYLYTCMFTCWSTCIHNLYIMYMPVASCTVCMHALTRCMYVDIYINLWELDFQVYARKGAEYYYSWWLCNVKLAYNNNTCIIHVRACTCTCVCVPSSMRMNKALCAFTKLCTYVRITLSSIQSPSSASPPSPPCASIYRNAWFRW